MRKSAYFTKYYNIWGARFFFHSANELCSIFSASISVESEVLMFMRFNVHLFRGYWFTSENRVTLLNLMKILRSDRFVSKKSPLICLMKSLRYAFSVLFSWHMLLITWKRNQTNTIALIVSTLYKCSECCNHTLLLILSCLSIVAFLHNPALFLKYLWRTINCF